MPTLGTWSSQAAPQHCFWCKCRPLVGFLSLLLLLTSCCTIFPTAQARVSSKQLSSYQDSDSQLSLADHGLEDTASFYIADIPDRYIQGVSGLGSIETNAQYGFVSLGNLLSPGHDHWDTVWHQIDAWYNNQMMVSPLRTWHADEADIIFVPAMLSMKSPADLDSFVEDAYAFLPYLGSKPHILVLSHAALVYNRISRLLTHQNSRLFLFLSFVQYDETLAKSSNSTDLSHVLGCPQFSHVHWSQGAWQLQPEGRKFNAADTVISKSMFSTESFGVRHYEDRFAAFEDCNERNDLCTHLDYTGPQDAVPVYEAYRAAWFVLHPRADFIARSAWFDTLLADSIPVVFQPEYIKAVPFADVLDYDRLMIVVPEEVIEGQDGQNIVDILWDGFNQEDALRRIEYIHSVRHVFQYMVNPRHELVAWSQRSKMHPNDDAFTFTLKSVLRKLCQDGWLAERCQMDGAADDSPD